MMQGRPRQWGLGAAAILLSLAVISSLPQKGTKLPVRVLVAERHLPVGHILGSRDFRLVEKASFDPSEISDQELHLFLGQHLVHSVPAGETLKRVALREAKSAPLSHSVPRGKRSLALEVLNSQGVVAGDRVDVFRKSSVSSEEPKLLAQAVLVLGSRPLDRERAVVHLAVSTQEIAALGREGPDAPTWVSLRNPRDLSRLPIKARREHGAKKKVEVLVE